MTSSTNSDKDIISKISRKGNTIYPKGKLIGDSVHEDWGEKFDGEHIISTDSLASKHFANDTTSDDDFQLEEEGEEEELVRLEALSMTESPKPLLLSGLSQGRHHIYYSVEANNTSDVLAENEPTCSSASVSLKSLGISSSMKGVSHHIKNVTWDTSKELHEEKPISTYKLRFSQTEKVESNKGEYSQSMPGSQYGLLNEYVYSMMLSSNFSESVRDHRNNIFHKCTFTCPSCHMLHGRPGRCPCCRNRPKRPVLLCMPWRSHTAPTGLDPKSALWGTGCMFHDKSQPHNMEISCSMSPDIRAFRFSMASSADENTPLITPKSTIKPPMVSQVDRSWAQSASSISASARIQYHANTDAPKLPTLKDYPPILSAFQFRQEGQRRSRQARVSKISRYMDARSSALQKQKKEKSLKLPHLVSQILPIHHKQN